MTDFPNFTRHAERRIAQRGIATSDIELIEWMGTEVEGGYLVRSRPLAWCRSCG